MEEELQRHFYLGITFLAGWAMGLLHDRFGGQPRHTASNRT